MQTRLNKAFLASPLGKTADKVIRSCVHCGFCNATCPTYQLLGDELDALQEKQPDLIATANIGCLLQLQANADVEVVHWVELLAPR